MGVSIDLQGKNYMELICLRDKFTSALDKKLKVSSDPELEKKKKKWGDDVPDEWDGYFCLSKYEQAVEVLRGVFEQNLENPIFHSLLSDSLAGTGKHKEAREHLRKAIKLIAVKFGISEIHDIELYAKAQAEQHKDLPRALEVD